MELSPWRADFAGWLIQRWWQRIRVGKRRLVLRYTSVSPSHMPPLADHTEGLTGLAEPFAERWPALKDIPFFLAVGDGAAANVGSGCISQDKAA